MELAHLLGEQIRVLRDQAGLTQNQLAVKVGKDADYISKIERGKRTPSLGTLQKICKILNVKMYEAFKIIDL